MQLSNSDGDFALESIPLSVVIPTYGRSKDLEGLLSSVKPDEKTHEVIVVDDCSVNLGEFDTLKKNFPDVRFIHLEKNVGPGQARNEGARFAQGEILLYLDSDTELVSGGIDLLIDFARKHPDIKIFSGWDSPVPLNSGFFPRFKALFMVVGAPNTDADVSFIAGRCFAIDKEVMIESGGFNAEYKGADVEDFEFGYRLRRKYGEIRYLNGLRVHHCESGWRCSQKAIRCLYFGSCCNPRTHNPPRRGLARDSLAPHRWWNSKLAAQTIMEVFIFYLKPSLLTGVRNIV